MKSNLAFLLLVLGFTLPLHAIEITTKKLDNGFIQVHPDNFYIGNDNIALVSFSFYFDDLSPLCNMIVSETGNKMRMSKPIGVSFRMEDGTTLTFGQVASDNFIIFRLDFLHCVSSDFKGNYSEASFPERVACGLNKLSQVNIKEIEVNFLRIPITQPTASVFKDIITKGISLVKNKKNYALYGKSQNSTPQSNSSLNSKSSSSQGKSSTNNKPTKKTAIDESLRKFINKPLGYLSPDVYSSYPKALEYIKGAYKDNYSTNYDGQGLIGLHRMKKVNVGGYPLQCAFLTYYNNKTQWSYTLTDDATLSEAKDMCNTLAQKIRALGIELTNKPSTSFPVDYNGKTGNRTVTLSATEISNKYYVSLRISEFKDIDQNKLTPILSISEIFDRPLGAQKGSNPINWFMENGYAGKINEKKTEVKDHYSAGENYRLHFEIPIQGSQIYQGLKSSSFSLKLSDPVTDNWKTNSYTIELYGKLKPSIESWNINAKQEKKEIKYIWNNLILELLKVGHKPIKAKNKSLEFKQWDPTECYIEHDGAITRKYILTKNNKIIITEQRP